MGDDDGMMGSMEIGDLLFSNLYLWLLNQVTSLVSSTISCRSRMLSHTGLTMIYGPGHPPAGPQVVCLTLNISNTV